MLHTKDDRELLELLSPPKPWEQIQLEMSTFWASQVADDGQHPLAVPGRPRGGESPGGVHPFVDYGGRDGRI